MHGNGEKCPKCNEFQMPVVAKDSRATARACQNCGFVEELDTFIPPMAVMSCGSCLRVVPVGFSILCPHDKL